MLFPANCRTTAMGIMPHRDIDRALKLVLGLDIPFWPQLPHVSFYEDMYVQFSQHFPGIEVDFENQKLRFSSSRFKEEISDYSLKMDDPRNFSLSEQYSVVYHRFLSENLSGYTAIRGQLIGPVSFGFRVMDENNRPIIYDDDVRALLFDFIQRKINAQYRQLKDKNPNAFVWLDEPGLGWVFSGLSGYSDVAAKNDYAAFFSGLEGIKALHLCANVNLPYLLKMGTELLSFDSFQIEVMPRGYTQAIGEFLESGGILAWGIVPTDSDNLGKHTPESLTELLIGYWKVVAENTGISLQRIARQSLIAPARCCLKNTGRVGTPEDAKCIKSDSAGQDLSVEEQLVEKAFGYLKMMSGALRVRFDLE